MGRGKFLIILLGFAVCACNPDGFEGIDSLSSKNSANKIGSADGHYISFPMTINLQTEMVDRLENPKKYTNYHHQEAVEMEQAIQSPGVRGLWFAADWKAIETREGFYDWALFDANLEVAKRYKKKVIFHIADRSFNGQNIMPEYLTLTAHDNVIPVESGRSDSLNGYVSKRWSPYVAARLIELYRAVGKRYDGHPNFAGFATSETALGNFDTSLYGYTVKLYEEALINIINQSKAAFSNSKIFFYLNFVGGGARLDLEQDSRIKIIRRVADGRVALGGPDVMADDKGRVDSASPVAVWAKENYPLVPKFCHAQYNDYKHPKDNTYRLEYFERTGEYPNEILRSTDGKRVQLHPAAALGQFWTPKETFIYAKENYACDYFFWHYKKFGGATDIKGQREYMIDHVLPVIAQFPRL